MILDQSNNGDNVYCGVVIVNALLGGLNLLFNAWLARDRRTADSRRMQQHENVMRRLDGVTDAVGPSGPASCKCSH